MRPSPGRRGALVIAGGSLERGSASDVVLTYRPGEARVERIGRLPAATTHAAAAALDGVAYVIGGRGASVGTPTARIVAIDARTGRIRAAGLLRSPRSDLAAVALGDRILARGRSWPRHGVTSASSAAGRRRGDRARRREAPPPRRERVRLTTARDMLTGAARRARPLVYVPNSESDTVDVIDPRTLRIVGHFAVGGLPQHVVPAWDLRDALRHERQRQQPDADRSAHGQAGGAIPVDDPYNLYFTPDGRYAIVVAERLHRLDFRDPHTFALRHSLAVPCRGVDHMDFTADGRFLLASCEFSGQMVVVDVRRQRVVRTIDLPDGARGCRRT